MRLPSERVMLQYISLIKAKKEQTPMTTQAKTLEPDRVRANTAPEVVERLDETLERSIRFYATQPEQAISARIDELEREWDIERILETNASALALGGICGRSPGSVELANTP